MKFCLLLSAITLVTARTIFDQRTRIKYSFEEYADYQIEAETAAGIVERDVGSGAKWGCSKQIPPTCYPPPLTERAISDIKGLEGLEVEVIPRRRHGL